MRAYDKAIGALGDPTRRIVYERLRRGPRSVGDIADGLTVSRPAVSQHLRVLKDAGLVREHRVGTRNFYSVDRDGLTALREYFEAFWEDALAAFKDVADREKGETRMSSTRSGGIEPVHKSIAVETTVERAFEIFTERMGDWWPVETHSVHEELAQRAGLEPRAGGRLFEVGRDGLEHWGTITVWEPPHRLVCTWHPGHAKEEATEVEVRFIARGNSTLVELEHRGWEARGARAEEFRAGYDTGWDRVLEPFVALAASAGQGTATGARSGT